jgi:VRR-NUC domain
VLDVARAFHWRSYHARPARTEHGWRTPVQGDGAGWPDVVLVRGGRGVALELKTEIGRVTPEQEAWIAAFALLPGWHAQVMRPRDREAIRAMLAAKE